MERTGFQSCIGHRNTGCHRTLVERSQVGELTGIFFRGHSLGSSLDRTEVNHSRESKIDRQNLSKLRHARPKNGIYDRACSKRIRYFGIDIM